MSERLVFRPQSGSVPHAVPSPVSAPYWEAATRGELLFQACTFCETVNAPPTEICRECLLPSLRWEKSAGLGALYSWTVVHRPVTPEFVTPYAPAIVDMDEGFQLVTNLVDVLVDDIVAGMRLRIEFHPVGGGLHLPYAGPVR
jgi:uncharacterized OB-fold protein